MVINQYTTDTCTPSSIYEQDIFLADEKCHAIEFHQSFYKASCSGGTMKFTVCDDPVCSKCTSSSILDAGTFVKASFQVAGGNTCSARIDGQPVQVNCQVLSGGGASLTTTGSGSGPSGTAATGGSTAVTSKNGGTLNEMTAFLFSFLYIFI